jgi:hypothetical protein
MHIVDGIKREATEIVLAKENSQFTFLPSFSSLVPKYPNLSRANMLHIQTNQSKNSLSSKPR